MKRLISGQFFPKLPLNWGQVVGDIPQVEIFYSNRIEFLVPFLEATLFSGRSKESLFHKKILICPSKAMRNYLSQTLAEKRGILAGVEFLYINQAIFSLFKKRGYTPSSIDLTLELSKLLQEEGENESPYFPLVLSKLFQQYPIQIPEEVMKWENEGSAKSLQPKLWKKLFSEQTPYASPLSLFDQTPEIPEGIEWHFFGFSDFSPFHVEIFKKLEGLFPIYHYCLSPCQVFWSDVLSDKEAYGQLNLFEEKKVQREEIEQLDLLLREKHPLLANFGKVGRETAKLFDTFDATSRHTYGLPKNILAHERYQEEELEATIAEKEKKELTALDLIQAEMTFLKAPPKTPFQLEDHSIEIHLAQNRYREVEILKDNILRALKEDEHLRYHQISVMAPDINLYAPIIDAVFGEGNIKIDFQLVDIRSSAQGSFSDSLIEAFLLLLDAGKKSFQAPLILELLEHPAFNRKARWSTDDLRQIEKWIEKTSISWGFDPIQREEHIKKQDCNEELADSSPRGTWIHGLKQLAFGLVLEGKEGENDLSATPFSQIELSDTSLLNSLLETLFRLKDAFDSLLNEDKTPKEFGTLLEELLLNFLLEETSDERQIKEKEVLLAFFSSLKTSPANFNGERFSFDLIYKMLLREMDDHDVGFRESDLGAVKVCSLLPMRALPVKALFILGLEKEAFPRSDRLPTYNLIKEATSGKSLPQKQDYDRLLFLETLLSARNKITFSYQGAPSDKGDPPVPAPPLSELINYLDKLVAYKGALFSQARIYRHPFSFFDSRYFDGSFLPSFNHAAFNLASKSLKNESAPPPPFFPEYRPGEKPFEILIGTPEKIVDIKDLKKCLKTPLKTYLEKTLNLYPNRKEDELKGHEPVHFNHLEEYLFLEGAIKKGFEKEVLSKKKSGAFPLGIFSKSLENLLREKMEQIEEERVKSALPIEELKDYELTLTETNVEKGFDRNLLLPALPIEVEGVGKVRLVGTLPNILNRGLLVLSKESDSVWFSHFPLALIGQLIEERLGIEGPVTLHFLKRKNQNPTLSNRSPHPEKTLSDILAFYFRAAQSPCPIEGSWALEFIKNDPESLLKNYMGLFAKNEYTPEDLLPFFATESLPDPEKVLNTWSPYINPIVEDFRAFLSKGKSKGKSQ